jgi:plasmid stabilization system protein ParE
MKKELLLQWSPKASKQFLEISNSIAKKWSLKTAIEFADKVDLAVNALKTMPEAFPESVKKKVRMCVISRQTTALYRLKKDTVEILVLFDTRQSLKKLKKELKKF